MFGISRTSGTALIVLSGSSVLLGGMLQSPEAGLLSFALAGLLAAPAACVPRFRAGRIAALFLLALAVTLAIPACRARSSLDLYRGTAVSRNTT